MHIMYTKLNWINIMYKLTYTMNGDDSRKINYVDTPQNMLTYIIISKRFNKNTLNKNKIKNEYKLFKIIIYKNDNLLKMMAKK